MPTPILNPSERRRRLSVTSGMLLTAVALAGSATSNPVPSHTGAALSVTPEEARVALVSAVEGAAAQVGGEMNGQLTANRCARELGDGVQFVYEMGMPDNHDVPATLSRVAAVWERAGIATTLTENQALHAASSYEYGSAPVWSVSMTARAPYDLEPAQYDILGFSLCAPGDYLDYTKIAAEHQPGQ